MKKIYFLYIALIISLLFLLSGCYPPVIPEGDDKYSEYSPEKAGVEVLLDEIIPINMPNPPDSPLFSKCDTYIYLFFENKILKFEINNLSTIHSEISIDHSSDLSVDTTIYKYERSGMITHNNKIVLNIHFSKIDAVDSKLTKYLQMDRDGNNKKLVTFNESAIISYTHYNDSNGKIMLLSRQDIILEYTYDESMAEPYTLEETYEWDGSMASVRGIFNENLFYHSFDSFGGYTFHFSYMPVPTANYIESSEDRAIAPPEILYMQPSLPPPTAYLYIYEYDYTTSSKPSKLLKTIDLGYLNIFEVSDIAIDGEYIWVLSKRTHNNTIGNYFKIVKIKPL